MTSSIQGVLIALLIAFIVGILVGYSFVQSRLKRQAEALKVSQRRLEEIEQSHELRLREATAQLRKEYEGELAETIEHYQDQLSQKAIEMEQIYETRFRVLQRGEIQTVTDPVEPDNLDELPEEFKEPKPPISPPSSVSRLPSRGQIEPLPEERDRTLSRSENLHLKKQYEARLKEAVQKLQSAYEQRLSNHAASVRENLKTAYEQRVAAKAREYAQQFEARQAALEQEYEALKETLAPAQTFTGTVSIPDPNESLGTGDETTMTLQSPVVPKTIPQQSTSVESVQQSVILSQDVIESRIQQVVDNVRQQYEQQLTQRLDESQQQFERKLQTVQSEYEKRIENLSASTSRASQETSPSQRTPDEEDDDFQPFDLSDLS